MDTIKQAEPVFVISLSETGDEATSQFQRLVGSEEEALDELARIWASDGVSEGRQHGLLYCLSGNLDQSQMSLMGRVFAGAPQMLERVARWQASSLADALISVMPKSDEIRGSEKRSGL